MIAASRRPAAADDTVHARQPADRASWRSAIARRYASRYIGAGPDSHAKSHAIPRRDQRLPARRASVRAERASPVGRPSDQRLVRRRPEREPRPRTRRILDVDDGVGQPAGRAHDRRRPVAQRDHLALAGRFEARRHHEEIGAGVDPAGHRPIESFDECHAPAAPRRPVRAAGAAIDGSPLAWMTNRAPSATSDGAALASRSKPFCGIEPPDRPEHGALVGGVEPDPVQQVAPARHLARHVARRRSGPRDAGRSRDPRRRDRCR